MTIEQPTPGGRPAADAAEARAITETVRVALREHARTGAVLARRVREAHGARVWIALGHPTWEAYARAEFGVSRASAYRLLDMATVLDQLDRAAAEVGVSPLGDMLEITRQQAREIKGRVPEVAAVLAELLAERGGPVSEPSVVADLLAAAVDRVRRSTPAEEDAPAPIPTGPHPPERRRRFEYWFGTVVLDTAPAAMTDAEAVDALRAHEPEITAGQLAHDLACRRYVLTGDTGALAGFFAGADLEPAGLFPAEQIGEGRRLVHRLKMLRWESGTRVLELAPAHLSDRAAARVLGTALGFDPESEEIAERLAERRYVTTGDYRAIAGWEAEAYAVVGPDEAPPPDRPEHGDRAR